MLGKFWEAVSGRLADRWATVAAPGAVFWLGGLLAWADHRGGLHELSVLTVGWTAETDVTAAAVLLTVLLAVFASGVIVDRLTILRCCGCWRATGRRGWACCAPVDQRDRRSSHQGRDRLAGACRHMQPSAQVTELYSPSSWPRSPAWTRSSVADLPHPQPRPADEGRQHSARRGDLASRQVRA